MQWRVLVQRYSAARSYLHDLYQVRDRWAWAWISVIFTAGIRTNGRVEVENRITKAISGPKKTLFQVFTALCDRTEEQQRDENIRVREHAAAFALKTCFKQMELSLYYDATALQLPDGVRNWRHMNDFQNDRAYIETRFLLRLIREQGVTPSHLLKVTHTETGATHIIALLPDGRYICDCCMGTNLGLVCRHYFVAWTKIPGLPFHISLIRARCV
ncbi:hypothetical protein FB451DRAFT_1059965 [Mycena latifolia]|nr:hypothetical protein FB451DRAFT_1059965 [Mycena latifolia]